MPKISNILVIVQRVNGDVFLANPLITALYKHYQQPKIDLLVNDDTLGVAETLQYINKIISFSYKKKQDTGIKQDIAIIKQIYKKYDLAINLTTSDRSVLYAILAAKKSISAVDKEYKKSWWKELLLSDNYLLDNKHTVINNSKALPILNIENNKIISSASCQESNKIGIANKLAILNIKEFIIFHPSAQYHYKIYPQHLRDELLTMLDSLDIAIIITGSNNNIDLDIKYKLPKLVNTYNFMGDTSLGELIVLSELSCCYIGMDTLNMHIAAAQNKPIFAIFGPTDTKIWSPWHNELQQCAEKDQLVQTYGNITLFQASMPCVPCAREGCYNSGRSECLYNIKPKIIFDEVKKYIN